MPSVYVRRSDAPEVQDALNRRLLASQTLNASCTKWDACMVKLFRNDWEESVIFLFSENRGFFHSCHLPHHRYHL